MKKILVIRDPLEPFEYEVVWDHLRKYHPDLQLTWQSLNDPIPDLAGVDLVASWLQDPCDNNPDIFGRACALEAMCDAVGVPIVNRPSVLPRSRKSVTAQLLRESGLNLRVPDMQLLCPGVPCTLPLPYFVRQDASHAGVLFRADTLEDASTSVFVDRIAKMREPVAVEYIETAREGIYWKYRYTVAGAVGVPLHLQLSTAWVTRGEDRLFTDEAVAAERHYVGQPANCMPALNAAARVLGFEFCAFDYTHDCDGRLTVWEVNPLPHLHLIGRADRDYRDDATRRTLDAVADLYRTRAR